MFNRVLEKELSLYSAEEVSIHVADTPNWYLIDIEGKDGLHPYEYTSEYERDADYQELKNIGFRN